MRAETESGSVYGAQIAVMRDGQVLFERAYGRKHRDRPDPVDIHTQFRIGSTTKTLTALALMQQVDAGRVDLDAPITTYLDDFYLAEPGQAEEITLRHLLTHTSGLHDTSAVDESDLFGPTDPGAMRRWVDEQRGQAPYAAPGRFWNYSSANYMYAGQILERVTGLSYPEYMDQFVFEPAGMPDSTMHAEEAVARGNYAYGHYSNPFSGRLEIYTLNDANNWARHPTGYANSTARDLAHFADRLMSGGTGLLSSGSIDLMQQPLQPRDPGRGHYYGLGTFTDTFEGNRMVHHDGGAWGWAATMKWIPSAGVAVATTTNVGGRLLIDATECAISAYVAPGADRVPPCERDPSSWGRFEGTYSGSVFTGEPATIVVARAESGDGLALTLTFEGTDPFSSTLTQSCGDWHANGPTSFSSGLGVITFIDDPIEPDVLWLRHRQFVGRREVVSPTPAPTADTTAPSLYLPRTG
jgi:CubicO group peptidase (beta-lactamase class C family)